jgi:hypothetical protein
MRNLIITTIALCMNILTLFFLFKINKKIKDRIEIGERNFFEDWGLLSRLQELEVKINYLEKIKVRMVKEIVGGHRIEYIECEELTELSGKVVCVVFKEITYKDKLLNPLQMCLEELAEEGYKYKLVDGNLEVTI